jgi:type II secretory pathway pseudopilin PulG
MKLAKRRGYILLEVAIGGAMVAVLCATILSSLADARVQNVVAGRDAVAGQLALEKLEQQRALGYTLAGTANCLATETVTNQQGLYTRTCTVQASPGTTTAFTHALGACTATCSMAATVNVLCRDVNVSVSYTAHDGKGTHTVAVKSKVCS